MTEPVLLPSSGKIVDRSTIAKHLLTDPSDPFNRQPLTLARVIPQEELRKRIQEWIQAQERGESLSIISNAVNETEETEDDHNEKMEVSGKDDQKIATVKTNVGTEI